MAEKGTATKGGKKNRKFGRGSRSPSMKRYAVENRAEVNKEKRQRKEAMRRAVVKRMATPRGSARWTRREPLHRLWEQSQTGTS